jgi:hypothetical protein
MQQYVKMVDRSCHHKPVEGHNQNHIVNGKAHAQLMFIYPFCKWGIDATVVLL